MSGGSSFSKRVFVGGFLLSLALAFVLLAAIVIAAPCGSPPQGDQTEWLANCLGELSSGDPLKMGPVFSEAAKNPALREKVLAALAGGTSSATGITAQAREFLDTLTSTQIGLIQDFAFNYFNDEGGPGFRGKAATAFTSWASGGTLTFFDGSTGAGKPRVIKTGAVYSVDIDRGTTFVLSKGYPPGVRLSLLTTDGKDALVLQFPDTSTGAKPNQFKDVKTVGGTVEAKEGVLTFTSGKIKVPFDDTVSSINARGDSIIITNGAGTVWELPRSMLVGRSKEFIEGLTIDARNGFIKVGVPSKMPDNRDYAFTIKDKVAGTLTVSVSGGGSFSGFAGDRGVQLQGDIAVSGTSSLGPFHINRQPPLKAGGRDTDVFVGSGGPYLRQDEPSARVWTDGRTHPLELSGLMSAKVEVQEGGKTARTVTLSPTIEGATVALGKDKTDRIDLKVLELGKGGIADAAMDELKARKGALARALGLTIEEGKPVPDGKAADAALKAAKDALDKEKDASKKQVEQLKNDLKQERKTLEKEIKSTKDAGTKQQLSQRLEALVEESTRKINDAQQGFKAKELAIEGMKSSVKEFKDVLAREKLSSNPYEALAGSKFDVNVAEMRVEDSIRKTTDVALIGVPSDPEKWYLEYVELTPFSLRQNQQSKGFGVSLPGNQHWEFDGADVKYTDAYGETKKTGVVLAQIKPDASGKSISIAVDPGKMALLKSGTAASLAKTSSFDLVKVTANEDGSASFAVKLNLEKEFSSILGINPGKKVAEALTDGVRRQTGVVTGVGELLGGALGDGPMTPLMQSAFARTLQQSASSIGPKDIINEIKFTIDTKDALPQMFSALETAGGSIVPFAIPYGSVSAAIDEMHKQREDGTTISSGLQQGIAAFLKDVDLTLTLETSSGPKRINPQFTTAEAQALAAQMTPFVEEGIAKQFVDKGLTQTSEGARILSAARARISDAEWARLGFFDRAARVSTEADAIRREEEAVRHTAFTQKYRVGTVLQEWIKANSLKK